MLQMPDILRNNDDDDDDADQFPIMKIRRRWTIDVFKEDIQMIIINN